MTSRLVNQSFLVTGSTSGIGFATAKALFDEGAKVVLHGLVAREDLSSEVKSLLETDCAHYIQADIGDATQASSLPDKAAELAAGLNGIVMSAAMAFHKDWGKVTTTDWDRVMQVNLRSNFLIAQSAAKHLIKSKGAMVAVSSTNALRANRQNLLYDSSKAALNHMFRDIALELREKNVRVNVVMPGGVDTPMLANWLKDYAGEKADQTLAEAQASGMLGIPTDIAMPILFLLSNEARWITGQTLIVDGGAILDS
jgi:NAD(P)-dependent dehydrogenase (short-subunit alcohol dehydrogenase family)